MNVSKQTKSYNLKAIDWLVSNNKINETLDVAYTYIKIKHLISKILPDYLKKSFYIIKTEQNSITIAVDNAIYATRMRQLSYSIVNELKITYSKNIKNIKIKIINEYLTLKTKTIIKKKNNISIKGINSFEQLQENSKPGPLKDAIKRLIAHHKL
ncbi:hypothetical protein CONE_0833 [Candidatus Kinetoplastibacterium oncopeltii TCC290E]|uniref:DUF721 domain-containing protein n=1 Tax=Candidatus Kinetoplastidibacterium stringomonadis TCC290E TaxID=1208920 RepID=M1M9A7_9PROT|nr:hypothetical protein [Candidatus Kinetoplastibacterium oncopeltii]AGF48550.1 hypothetical protein CONE_0833 [Candidatus Kinetoplastibacterium oncopeltii TCC290E]